MYMRHVDLVAKRQEIKGFVDNGGLWLVRVHLH